MKKTIFASLLNVLLLSFALWLAQASAESLRYDGTWKGEKMGVFITIVIEGGTLKSIDAEYYFTNKMNCNRGNATFSDGFKGSRTFSQLIPDSLRKDMKIPDSLRKDMKIKGDSFVWDLSQFFPEELIVNGTFADEKIVRGTIVSKCPSYVLSWNALKR
jgi:hypothetical protein